MSLVIRRRTVLIIIFAAIFVISVLLMFSGNYPKVVYEKQINPVDLEKVSTRAIDDNTAVQVAKNLENDFFIDYKLERDRLRSQEADYLRELINNPNASIESKEKAQQDLIALSQKVEKEMVVENLIKAKGFDDVVVYLDEGIVNVILPEGTLSSAKVAQIQDIIVSQTGLSADNIKIMEKS